MCFIRFSRRAGSDTYILDNGGEELLFVDCGFACYREEMTGIFEGLFPDFHSRRKTLVTRTRISTIRAL